MIDEGLAIALRQGGSAAIKGSPGGDLDSRFSQHSNPLGRIPTHWCCTDKGTPFDLHNLINRQLKPTCQKLGLTGVSWHWLRHASATLLDAVGTSLGTSASTSRALRTEEECASSVCHVWVGQSVSQPKETAVGDQRITVKMPLRLAVNEAEGNKPE